MAIKTLTKSSAIALSCFFGYGAWAQMYTYQLSEKGCQLESFAQPNKLVCKFIYTIDMPHNLSNKLWIKATQNIFTSSEDGRLHFSLDNSNKVKGILSINQRQVKQLTIEPQVLKITDAQ